LGLNSSSATYKLFDLAQFIISSFVSVFGGEVVYVGVVD
jgi:hypothetical protein